MKRENVRFIYWMQPEKELHTTAQFFLNFYASLVSKKGKTI